MRNVMPNNFFDPKANTYYFDAAEIILNVQIIN